MTPKAILGRLEVIIGVNGAPHRLRAAIEEQLCDHFGLSPLSAAERAEELEKSVATLIEMKRREAERAGILAMLVLSSASARSVMGSCWVEPSDRPDIAAAKVQRFHVDALLQAIRALTFTEFEIFGTTVLKTLGAQSVQVTPHADDQGIDFYGLLSLGSLGGLPSSFMQLAHDVELRFAGQAKHYPNAAIGPSVLRELVGAIALARYKVYSNDHDLFEDLQLRAFNPLLAMIFTTGRFTNGARQLAERAGILARSGEQLAVFLADRGVGMKVDTSGSICFSRDRFRTWVGI
jgi:Restriction endonuclease